MSMKSLETAIRNTAAGVLCNPKLCVKDIVEWANAKIEPQAGEVVVELPTMGLFVAVLVEHDKRPKAT